MFKLELKEGMGVFTADDEQIGKVNGFVLDPATNELTHIVVQKGWLLPEDKVLPFEMVDSAAEDKVIVNEDLEKFEELPDFEAKHYVVVPEADISRGGNPRYRIDQPPPIEETTGDESIESDVSRGGRPRYSTVPTYYWYPPHGYSGYPVGYYGWPTIETVQNIPEDTIPIREGTSVISADGEYVGDIERLFVDPQPNKVTHFVIAEGTFFKDRKLIPAHWVRTVGENRVQLCISSQLLEELSSYEE